MGLELSAILAAQDRARVIWSLFGPTAGTVAAIIVLIWGVLRLGAWLREEEEDPGAQTHEMLSQYREMHENGELTDEEYRLIKNRLIGLKPTETQLKAEELVENAGTQVQVESPPVAPDSTEKDQEA